MDEFGSVGTSGVAGTSDVRGTSGIGCASDVVRSTGASDGAGCAD